MQCNVMHVICNVMEPCVKCSANASHQNKMPPDIPLPDSRHAYMIVVVYASLAKNTRLGLGW